MEKLKWKRLTKGQRVVFSFFFVLTWIVSVWHASIFVVGILQGLKSHTEAVIHPFSLPTVWHFENYINAFTMLEVKGVNFIGMMINSLWYAFGTTILMLIGEFCLTYVIVRYTFPGSKLLNWLGIFIMMVPTYGSSGSLYVLLYRLGLANSPFILLKSWGAFGHYLILRAFIQNLTRTYSEAAEIDGASDFRIMWQINFPLLLPSIMALFVIIFGTQWNTYQQPLLFLQDLPVLPVGLHLFEQDMQYRARMDILFAAGIISGIPYGILAASFHKTLLNLTIGSGLKG